MTAAELIIDNPRLVRPGQKFTALGITLLFWGMLLYLWQPLISLLAWGFNIQLFHSHMVMRGGYQALLDVLWFYGLVIVCLACVLLAWARLQWWRFRNGGRRRSSERIGAEAMAAHFGVSTEQLQAARRQRELHIRLAADGKIAQLEESVGKFCNKAREKSATDCK